MSRRLEIAPQTAAPSAKGRNLGARRAKAYVLTFLILIFSGIGAVSAGHVVLAQHHLLPPPPIVATDCIDSKFSLLRKTSLKDVTVVAVGSSATWRNLDLQRIEQAIPGSRAYNAAPCWLHIDQTAYLADQLLEQMPQVDTVISVVAPRDFEACLAAGGEFFDKRLFHAYIDGAAPAWLPYVTGFRSIYLARQAITLRRGGDVKAEDVLDDRYGSSILLTPQQWRPPLQIDPNCYAGLTKLEDAAVARGARLIVAVLPVMPEWAIANDPDGTRVQDWVEQMERSLRRPESRLVDGRSLNWNDKYFADPVHLLYPHHTAFTQLIAGTMARDYKNAQTGVTSETVG